MALDSVSDQDPDRIRIKSGRKIRIQNGKMSYTKFLNKAG
jgi:hypothetical protein